MTTRRLWRDADAAAAALRTHPADRRTLLVLAHLPLLPAPALQRLAGLGDWGGVYRSLRRLDDAGLVAAIRPPLRPGHTPRLWHLTDLGLAVVARDHGVDVGHLARRNRLRRADLLAQLPGLPQLLAVYDLLAALAAARPGPVNLLAWERPWRRRSRRPTAKQPITVVLPAYAALRWDEGADDYLLLPDLATVPLAPYRPVLHHLLTLRGLQGGALPTLVVATPDEASVLAWAALLDEVQGSRAEAPLAACVVTWEDLCAGRAAPPLPAGGDERDAARLVRRVRLRPGPARRPGARLPRLVGAPLDALQGQADAEGLGRAALGLSEGDRTLLDLVGRHPFLPTPHVATVLGTSIATVRRRRTRLIAAGLLRLVGPEEVDATLAGGELLELTAAGLALVAAQQGLPLGAAVRVNGLAGGGPDRPIGPRRILLGHLAHTLGADAVFVRLIAMARRAVAAGRDDALVEWRSAAACARGRLRPDGYGIYRHRGRLYGFFLEFDRGTMSARDYRKKLATYYAYWSSGRFARDYRGFPTILVVTTDDTAEERIARAARAAASGRGPALPMLLTCQWRVDEPRNPDGLLGTIWREPSADAHERRRWPLPGPGLAEPPPLPGRRG